MKKLVIIIVFLTMITPDIFSQGGILENPTHDPAKKTEKLERIPMSYQFVREADVLWDKRVWQEIDLREKKNQVMLYPLSPKNGRQNFAQTIFDAVNSGKLSAYKVDPFGNDEFTLEDEFTVAEWSKRINDSIADTW